VKELILSNLPNHGMDRMRYARLPASLACHRLLRSFGAADAGVGGVTA